MRINKYLSINQPIKFQSRHTHTHTHTHTHVHTHSHIQMLFSFYSYNTIQAISHFLLISKAII